MIAWFEVSAHMPGFVDELSVLNMGDDDVTAGRAFFDVNPYDIEDIEIMRARGWSVTKAPLMAPVLVEGVVRFCAAEGDFLHLLDKYSVSFPVRPASWLTRPDGNVLFLFLDSWELLRDAVEGLFGRWVQVVFTAMVSVPAAEQTEAWFVERDYDWFAGCWFFWKNSLYFPEEVMRIVGGFMDEAAVLFGDA